MDAIEAVKQYNDIMIRFFSNLAIKFDPESPSRVGWSSRDTQSIRFQVLNEIGSLSGHSILDVGCGVGDFYGFLVENGINADYTGYDILQENCSAASKKYGVNKFLCKTIFDDIPQNQFDFILASGIFFLKSEHWDMVVQNTVLRMFELSRIGIGFNFLSSLSIPENDFSYHADPLQILRLISSITTIFQIRHDYSKKGNDFTVFAYHKSTEVVNKSRQGGSLDACTFGT